MRWRRITFLPRAAASSRPNARISGRNFLWLLGVGAEITGVAEEEDGGASVTTLVREESIERLMRRKSARISAALWQRISGSFSKALLMVSSSFGGSSGFRRLAAVGVRFRMASVMTAEVSPRNGRTPVAIS